MIARLKPYSQYKNSGVPWLEHIHEEPYRFLICADKFQTGYDEPLLHTMYVDALVGKELRDRRLAGP